VDWIKAITASRRRPKPYLHGGRLAAEKLTCSAAWPSRSQSLQSGMLSAMRIYGNIWTAMIYQAVIDP